MSSFQCCMGWTPSIGCHQDICTQIHERVKFSVCHIKYALHFAIHSFNYLALIYLTQSFQVRVLILWIVSPFYASTPTPSDIFFCYLWCKNLVSKHLWIFYQVTQSLWWPTLPDVHTKYNSQSLKGCQFSNAIWDGACQSVATKISAPKYVNKLALVSNSLLTTSSMHCILLFLHLVILPLSIWLNFFFSRSSYT